MESTKLADVSSRKVSQPTHKVKKQTRIMTSIVKSGYLKNHLAMAPQNFSFSNNAESRPRGQDQSKGLLPITLVMMRTVRSHDIAYEVIADYETDPNRLTPPKLGDLGSR